MLLGWLMGVIGLDKTAVIPIIHEIYFCALSIAYKSKYLRHKRLSLIWDR